MLLTLETDRLILRPFEKNDVEVTEDEVEAEIEELAKKYNMTKEEVKKQYGENPLENQNFGKIINQKHFERLLGLIQKDKVVFGGNSDSQSQRIEPTVMDNVSFDDAVMQEEIFGPVMPIITYDKFDDIFEILNARGTPLAQHELLKNYKENKDMANYTIYVHSLKSDAKYLGFMELANVAYEHELKSKEKDEVFVNNHFKDLEYEYNKVMSIIDEFRHFSKKEKALKNQGF